MDFKSQLLKEHSKANAVHIANTVGRDPLLFAELIELMYDSEYRIAQRAAHAVSHCADRYQELIVPHIDKMVNHLDTKPKVAIRRNIVRILQKHSIPESLQGKLVNHCFDYLVDAKETIAVKAFAMTILTNMAKTYPELGAEVSLVINDLLEHNPTPGIRARGKKLLKQLSKISTE